MNTHADFTPKDWGNLLNQATQSQKLPKHQYIVHSKDGKIYRVMSQEDIEKSAGQFKKLPITEIVKYSNIMLQEAKKVFEENPEHISIKAHSFIDLTTQISQQTQQLLNERELKRKRSVKFEKGVTWLLSIASSIFGIGKSLLRKMQEAKIENEGIKNTINQWKQDSLIKDLRELNKRLEYLPKIADEIKKRLSSNEIENRLNLIIENELQVPQSQLSNLSSAVSIFKEDIQRGISFLRIDHEKGIKDNHPLPSNHSTLLSNDSQRLEEGINLLKELIGEKDKNKPWSSLLQIAASQTTLNSYLSQVKGIFSEYMMESSEDKTGMWTEKGHLHMLQLEESLSPIKLEIIRDHETKEIKEILVHSEAILNIYKKDMLTKSAVLIKPHAYQSNLTYSIILTDQIKPCIEKVNLTITSN